MTDNAAFHLRRQALESSFDGPVPRSRLPEPEPSFGPACTYGLQRRIAMCRQRLSAAEADGDGDLHRLTRHLAWLVLNERHDPSCCPTSTFPVA